MRILLAIDSFKGCLSSADAEQAVSQGIKQSLPGAQVLSVPVSDGGEGMLDAFAAAMQATLVTCAAHDPLMRPITARYGLAPDGTAIVEMAQASGLALLQPEERNPLIATSFGTGELIADALRRGCKRLIVGLGGSATVDGGRGMLQALGATIGNDEVDLSQSLLAGCNVPVTIAGDVRNPLLGNNGAATVFGPQKGATPAMVSELEHQMEYWADLTAHTVGHDCRNTPGAGAAGGLGFALLAYMNATMRSGIDLLMDLLDFDRLLAGCDLAVTGEGSADRQTLMGKLPGGILRRAQQHGIPTLLIAGRVSDRQALLDAGFAEVHCINPADSPLSECMQPDIARQRLTGWARTFLTKHFS